MRQSSEAKKKTPCVTAGTLDPKGRDLISAGELSRRIKVCVDTIYYYTKSGIYSRDKTRVVKLASIHWPRTVMTSMKAYHDFLEEINRVHPTMSRSSEKIMQDVFAGKYSAKMGDCVILRLPENAARHLVKQLHPEDWVRHEINEILCHFE